jgi:hypothetical protein
MQRIVIFIFSAALGFSAACEDTTDDPQDAGSTEAGKGGDSEGGKSGSAGNAAGKGGSGGKAGSAGHANAGSGGKAGTGAAGQDGDAGPSDDDAGASHLPKAFKISFSTTECFGMCPVYSVTLDQAGNVEWSGEKNVDKLGKSTKKVAATAAAEVYEALQSAGYFELKDAYAIDSPDCERARTDASTHKWSVEHDGKTKPLSQYLGCEGVDALDKVREASKLLIEKTAISEWIGA